MAQASVVPDQAAGRNDAPYNWFGCARQFLVVDFDKTIRGQHASPVLGEPLVATEILHQFASLSETLVPNESEFDG